MVLLGMSSAGKSSLIDRFMGHSFSEEYEDIYRRALMVEGESCLLEVVAQVATHYFSQ